MFFGGAPPKKFYTSEKQTRMYCPLYPQPSRPHRGSCHHQGTPCPPDPAFPTEGPGLLFAFGGVDGYGRYGSGVEPAGPSVLVWMLVLGRVVARSGQDLVITYQPVPF